jgi:branched-chain amino acid transport system permease protein
MQRNSKESSSIDVVLRTLPYVLVAGTVIGALITRTPDPWITVVIAGMLVLGVVNFAVAWRMGRDFSVVDYTIDALRYIIIGLVLIGSVNTLAAGRYTTEQWVNLFISGLAQGSIYALIALGYTLVYGILLMINFAHGEVYMAGSFTAVFLAEAMNRSGFMNTYPVLAIPLLIIFAGLVSMTVAVLLERIAYRPLRNAPRLVPLITAIGASFFLQYTFRGFYGSGHKTYPTVEILSGTITVPGLMSIPVSQIFVFFAALVLMGGLYLLVERTKLGKAMRSVSENKEVSQLMGIDIDRIILFTFAIGGALAGAAGVINGLFRPQGVNFTMGFVPGIKAFTSAVLGGIGNVPGAMVGGLFLGVIENIGPTLVLSGLGIPGVNQLKDVIAFTMLVLVLIFRPQGILGERLSEKKA